MSNLITCLFYFGLTSAALTRAHAQNPSDSVPASGAKAEAALPDNSLSLDVEEVPSTPSAAPTPAAAPKAEAAAQTPAVEPAPQATPDKTSAPTTDAAAKPEEPPAARQEAPVVAEEKKEVPPPAPIFRKGVVGQGQKKPAQYSKPLHFEMIGNGVELPPPDLEYDLSSQNSLKIAGAEVSTANVFAALVTGKNIDPRLASKLSAQEASGKFFIMSWPDSILPEGQLEAISRSGRVVWKVEVNAQAKDNWKRLRLGFAKRMLAAGVSKDEIFKSKNVAATFGMPVEKTTANPLAGVKEPYRFCLTRTDELGYSRICTPLYETRRKDSAFALTLAPASAAPARVIAFNLEAPLKNAVPVGFDQPVQFFAELNSGVTYEFVSLPKKMNFIEVTADKNGKEAALVAWGAKPLQAVKELNPKDDGYLTQLLGLQETIGDFRVFWTTKVSLSKPVLYVPGTGGGPFRQRINILRLPREGVRPFAREKTIEGTYVDGAKIYGYKSKEVQIGSTQKSTEVSKNGNEFIWYFEAKKRGEVNKSYLDVKDGEDQFKVYHEMYKGYPREISTRLSGIISSEGKVVIMGEFSFQNWFEDLFGWTNYYLARQRWGLSIKYFQSLSNFALGTNSAIMKIVTADAKFRLEPGLWNRDESWGGMLSYQKLNYSVFDATLVGGGIFWARSMPRVFDDLFNFFWFMRYPKWVDAEFIYYAAGDSKNVVRAGNYALNFHGKIMWTNSLFGEAGFGLKQYNFDDKTSRLNMRFASIYGTAGIGLNF